MVVWRHVGEFARATPADLDAIVGQLNQQVSAVHAQHWGLQTQAWTDQLPILQRATEFAIAKGLDPDALLVFEYDIPRRSKRPDVLLVLPDAVVVIEFKVGATQFDATARWQISEYALDLRDFHSSTHGRGLAGVLVATRAPRPRRTYTEDRGIPIVQTNADDFGGSLVEALRIARESVSASPPPQTDWLAGGYKPTPNIIEAAEMLYKDNEIAEINHAYAQNLTETTDALVDHIAAAAANRQRVICFVTGVPGAGKTLTGLDAVHDPRVRRDGRPAGVFLSGNGPLVKVVQEALINSGKHASKKEARRTITTFVQNVHRFVANHADANSKLPPEHVVVFDEAQRAWSRQQMERKKRGAFSESEQLLDIMERLPEWCVLIALVGGGQEIHDGEAGLAAWGDALNMAQRADWKVIASPEVLTGGTSVSGHKLFREPPRAGLDVVPDSRLHLDVSVRSPRAQTLAAWVDAVLRNNVTEAARLAGDIREFPLVATRDLRVAKAWLRGKTADGQRAGLLASAGAKRLRAYGLQLSTREGQNRNVDHWFLAGPTDVRSSHYLEVAAEEFECQGLELDYVGLCWGDDLTQTEKRNWLFRRFSGTRWVLVNDSEKRGYMLNKYRVLLTRARKGIVIWVPPGDIHDATREPAPLDRTWAHLLACGVTPLQADVIETGGALAPEVRWRTAAD